MLTDENFNQHVLESIQPVVVYFCADWSGSCDIMHMIVDDLAERFAGEVTFGRIDSERHRPAPRDLEWLRCRRYSSSAGEERSR